MTQPLSSTAASVPRLLDSGPANHRRPLDPMPQTGWLLFGWFGLALLVVGVSDILLAGYPFRPGNPDWEFGFVHQTFSSLPLPTVGLAAVLAAAFARGQRWMVRGTAVTLLVFVFLLSALYLLFLLVVPLALQSAPEPVLPGIRKAILRTSVAGVVFPLTYLGAAIAAWRFSRAARNGD